MAIDPNIKKKADDIRNKIYGKEVRESLASGLEAMSTDVVDTVSRQGNVESQFQDVIENTTDKDVISAPEIIAARNGEANLKARLDKEHQEVTTQLEQIAINVKTFGAEGDGITDDTTAVQSAIDFVLESGGGIVFLPVGRYRIEGDIMFGSNMRMIGAGKETIIDGVKGYKQATIKSKSNLLGSVELYDGASNFSFENLSFDSSDMSRQGLYFDNCYNFKVINFWGLNTPMHYLDINNSKNGFFENIHLHQNEGSEALFQIDSATGENDGIWIKNVTAFSSKKHDGARVSYKDTLFHLHRTGGKNIFIDGVHSEDIPLFMYTDLEFTVTNLKVENIVLKNNFYPVYTVLNSKKPRSRDVVFKTMSISGTGMKKGFGDIMNANDVTLSDLSFEINDTEEERLVDFASCNRVKLGIFNIEGEYKKEVAGELFYYIGRTATNNYSIIEPINGSWQPEMYGSETVNIKDEVVYRSTSGTYTIIGNKIFLYGQVYLEEYETQAGELFISGMPTRLYGSLIATGSSVVHQGVLNNPALTMQLKSNTTLNILKNGAMAEPLKISDLYNSKGKPLFKFHASYDFFM